ncbi:MAG: metallophosphoesterase [Anaerolineae bacterium]|nr:metallophosphoesterase [Anaerolineae bacterium]
MEPDQLAYDQFKAFQERIGDTHLGTRLWLQAVPRQKVVPRWRAKFHFENFPFLLKLFKLILRTTGLTRLGYQNALRIQVVHNEVSLPQLPAAFDGYRILHLSDLHLDGVAGFGTVVANAIHGLVYDLCIITGDFRYHDNGPYELMLEEMKPIMDEIYCAKSVLAILGNHDYLQPVPLLEQRGIRFLINEQYRVERNGATMWIVGVDDPHYYELDDLDLSMETIPGEAFVVALVHSPELYKEAAIKNVALYLCGHTHGGQVCLPGGIPIMTNADCPRKLISGPWQYQSMKGYTSRGTGSSGTFVRYFCPPEVTLHTLVTG